MATAGLSFANPFMEKVGIGEMPNPYAPFNPMSNIGMGGLAPSAADMVVMGEALTKQSQFTMPEMVQPPSIAVSPSSKKVFVNGITFDADDADTALQSEAYLSSPGTGLPKGGDWVPIDEQAYGQYLNSIRNPSLGRLAQKNFGRGVDVMQMLGGHGLRFMGAEETGQDIVRAQLEDLRKTSPFERQYTDIGSAPNRGILDWFVATVSQQGPNIIESAVTAAIGATAGGLAGGGPNPLSAAAGALSALVGKSSVKQAVLAAAKKYAAGETLDAGEAKLLREMAGITAAAQIKSAEQLVKEGAGIAAQKGLQQSRIGGAMLATQSQNYATGIADIYGEGFNPETGQQDISRSTAAILGIPYSLLESSSEFLLAGRVLGGLGAPRALSAGASRTARGAEFLRRGAIGLGTGGVTEGLTETGQEGLLIGANREVDWDSEEGIGRLINSFAAGFAVGGPLGAVANLKGKAPANLLNPAQSPEQTPGGELTIVPPAPPAPPGTEVAPYYTPVTPMGGEAAPLTQLAGAPTVPQLTGPIPPVSPIGGPVIMAGMGPNAADVTRQDILLRQQGNVPPSATPGSQGVLDIFGGTIPAQELAARMQPQQPFPALPAPSPTAQPDTRQGALQFAGPAPTAPANTQMANQLQVIQDRVRRQREFEAAQAQQQAIIQQQTEELARQSANARDLYTLQNAPQQSGGQPPLPMRPLPIRQPQQLSLFTRKQAPVPSRAEGLKRGVGEGLPVAAPADIPLTAAQRRAQVPLFTQEGQPSMAALKSAGRKEAVKPVPDTESKQAPSTGKGESLKQRGSGTVTYDNGDTYTGQLKKGVPNGQGTYTFANGDVYAGQLKNGVPNGQGIYTFADGSVYIGSLKNSAFDGHGKFVGTDGTVFEGEFDNGDFLQPEEDTNAVQESSTKGVDVQEPPQDGAGVRGKDTAGGKAAGKGEALKTKTKKQEPTVSTVVEEEEPPPPPKGGKAKLTKGAEKKSEAKGESAPKGAALQKGPSGMAAMVGELTRERKQSAIEDSAPKKGVQETSAETEIANNELDLAIKTIDTISDPAERAEALFEIVSAYALNSNPKSYLLKTSTEFLANSEIPKGDFIAALKEVALNEADIGKTSRLYSILADHGLLNDADVQAKIRVPKGAKVKQAAVIDEPVNMPTENLGEIRMADLINNRDGYLGKNQLRRAALARYVNVGNGNFQVGARGRIKDFFTADGDPIIVQIPGTDRFVLATEAEGKLSKKEFAEKQGAARKALREIQDEESPTTLDDIRYDPLYDNAKSDRGNLEFFRVDGRPTESMKVGPLRLFVARVISKFARKPTVYVFANLADMQRSNPPLFAAAAKARKAGDIEHVNAGGMAWGNNVVLFADFIESEQQARFIIAHETLGHVGFRGLFSDKALDAILKLVADSDPQLRYAAEVYAAGRGIPFLEAVEEVLSDRAAAIDTNTILRFWNWLKDQLNKLGLKFNDDAARYLIGLSRQYIRQGVGRSEVNLSGFYKEIDQSLLREQSNLEVLRFAAMAPQGAFTFAMGNLNRSAAMHGGLSRALSALVEAKERTAEARKQGKGLWANTQNIAQSIIDGIQTMDNLARKSKGFSKVFELLQLKGARQSHFKQRYADGTATAHKAKFLRWGEGADAEQQVRAGELLAYGSLLKMNAVTDTALGKMDNPVFYDPALGEPKLAVDAFDDLVALGRVSIEDFNKGFEVQQGTKEVPMTAVHQQELAEQRDEVLGGLEQARTDAYARIDGKKNVETDPDKLAELAVERTQTEKKFDQDIADTKRLYTKRMNEKMYEVPNMVSTPAWFKDLKKDSIEWKIYSEFVDTMAQSHVDVLLSKYIGAVSEQKRAISAGVQRAFKKSSPLTDVERKFIEDVTALFDNMRMKGSKFKDSRLIMLATSEKDALEWLHKKFGRSFYNDLALGDIKSVIPGYTPAQVESIVKGMRNKLQTQIDPAVDSHNDSSIWPLIHRIEERSMFAASINDDQLYAKRSIAGSYVPLTREGEWQVRVQAYTTDKDGNKYPVKLAEGQQDSLAFYKTATQKDAEQYQEELNAMLNGEFDMRDDKGNLQKVHLEAVASIARQTPDLVDVLHYDEVMYSLSRLGIQITPEVRKVLVQKITGQNSRARANLRRAGVGGWDKDIVRSSSAFLEQQAYVAANKEFRHRFDEVLDDVNNWSDNPQLLDELKTKWEAAKGEAKEIAGREYFQEKFFQDNVVEYTKDGRRIERGQYYNERAKSMLAWMDSTGDIVHADDIWSNNQWSVATRTWAALAQLGGSIANGITQVLSLPTNSWAYLASYNPKTGFGVGLGAGKASKLLVQFLGKTANPKYADLSWLKDRLAEFEAAEKNGAKYTKDGLTGSELRFLLDMTEEQRLDAASFNAMTGTSKGRKITGNPTFQKFVQTWMFPFSYSEQVNRRVTLLAAYRGEYERQMAAHGNSFTADTNARMVATKALDATQGDYAQYNRPAIFRGGVQAFIYMYKQYPIMMVQLLRNMNHEGRIIMLGSLLLLSGVRGLPGADDLLDIIDAICQRLGLKIGSVEKEFARITADVFGAELAAEINPIIMRGVLDRVTGLSFSNRLGLGDIIPGTGILKPSATKDEILREVENLAGAPTSFLVGAVNWGANTLPAVLGGRQSPIELLRDSPIRAVKNVGDAWKYASTGAILDTKGYVVAQNATTWEILGKAMGFYPSRAQMQMDWMSADRQEQAYMSMVKTDLIREGVAAKLENDSEKLAHVKEFVRAWNEDIKGTRLEMRNFERGLTQAYKEASKPLAMRALKSSAKSGRMEAKDILRLYGVDEETLSGIPD